MDHIQYIQAKVYPWRSAREVAKLLGIDKDAALELMKTNVIRSAALVNEKLQTIRYVTIEPYVVVYQQRLFEHWEEITGVRHLIHEIQEPEKEPELSTISTREALKDL